MRFAFFFFFNLIHLTQHPHVFGTGVVNTGSCGSVCLFFEFAATTLKFPYVAIPLLTTCGAQENSCVSFQHKIQQCAM